MVLLFTLVRGRDGMVPKQTQTFSIPCAGRDEKVTGHGSSGFLHDSPPAIWHLHGEKPGGMGLPAKIEIILSSPSVPYLFPVL